MSARLELDDLPPRYRAQAEAQIAARQRGKCTHAQPMAEAASAAGRLSKTFDSYGEYVYYVHSFYARDCAAGTLAASRYGNVDVTGVVRRGNVYGTQFHPEKSGGTGLRLLRAFAEL